MTNFFCTFCGEKMEIPKEIKKISSPVTHVFWHEECIHNPEYKLSRKDKVFWLQMGKGNEF